MLNGRAAELFYGYRAAFGFLFYTFATLSLLYHHRVVGLDPLQMVLVGTVLELAIFVCEIPTGVVADVYSRRLSVAIGCVAIGLGFVVEGLFPTFAGLLIAQWIWGGGYTFISGAGEAWLADELSAENRGQALPKVLIRGAQCYQAGCFLGIGAAAALAAWGDLRTPLLAAGCGFMILGPVLRLLMPEQGFHTAPPGDRQTWKAMAETLSAGLDVTRRRPVLRRILGITFFFGMFSEAFDRLWVVHLSQGFELPHVPGMGEPFWFSLAHGVSLLLGIVVSELLRRLTVHQEQTQILVLMGLTLGMGLGVVLFCLAGTLWTALACFWAVSALRACLGPISSAWMNSHIPSAVRATVLSLNGQADALGQTLGGPALGLVGRQISVRAALGAAGVFLLPALALYARIPSREAEEAESP